MAVEVTRHDPQSQPVASSRTQAPSYHKHCAKLLLCLPVWRNEVPGCVIMYTESLERPT